MTSAEDLEALIADTADTRDIRDLADAARTLLRERDLLLDAVKKGAAASEDRFDGIAVDCKDFDCLKAIQDGIVACRRALVSMGLAEPLPGDRRRARARGGA